eukprot:4993983-Prymnesium_polylepis.1
MGPGPGAGGPWGVCGDNSCSHSKYGYLISTHRSPHQHPTSHLKGRTDHHPQSSRAQCRLCICGAACRAGKCWHRRTLCICGAACGACICSRGEGLAKWRRSGLLAL